MSTLLCAETDAVVKLDLGDKGGTRRIVFSRLWDPETSQASFGHLSFLAFKHSTLNRPGLHRAIITYTDVDGDTITISTHRELTEAFEQFVTHPSNTSTTIVLRAQVSFVKEKGGNNKVMLKKMEDNLEASLKIDSETGNRGKKGMRRVQLQPVLDSLVTNMTEAVEKLFKDVEGMGPRKIDGVTTTDIGKLQSTSDANEPLDKGNGKMNCKRGGRGRKWVQLQLVLNSFMTNMTETIESLSKDIEGMRPRNGNRVLTAKVVEVKEIGKLENTCVANNCGGNQSTEKVSGNDVAVSDGVGWEVVS